MSYDNLDKMRIDDNEYESLCLKYGKHRVDREIELELESKENAFNAYISKRNKAIERGSLGNFGATHTLISEAIPVFAKGLENWFKEADSGKAGRKHVASKLVRDFECEELAFIVTRVILESSLIVSPLTKLCNRIGEALEEELRYKMVINSMDKDEKGRFLIGLNKRVGLSYKSAYVRHKEAILNDEKRMALWNRWKASQKVQVGLKMVDIFIVSTGLGYLQKISYNAKTYYHFVLDEDVLKYLEHSDYQTATLLFQNRPMVIPPREWSTPFDGGYLIDLKKPLQLVRMATKDCRALYSEVDMPKVYKAVNAIQNTPWHINNKVLEVANEVCSWRHIPESLGMPLAEPDDPPQRPIEADTNEEVHIEWKNAMRHYYQEDNKRKSKRYLINGTLALANTFKDDEEIYFPHNLDFRGRVYPVTQLSPQGSDFVKSLIHFAKGVPLGDNGHVWLAFQGANCWGLDKKPFEERVAWVYENSEFINKVAEAPLDNLQWCEADSPWEFLAFCFEWSEYLKVGSSYVSHLPIAFDGSCSGLQHFSAMLRDEIGGEAVNLIPSDYVHDIYGIVASKVNERLSVDAKEGSIDEVGTTEDGTEYLKKGTKSLAQEWLKHGVTRKVTKRSTMTLCYGSSKFGFAEQVLEDTIYPALSKDPTAFSRPAQSARYMASLIWEALQGVVVKAVEAMEWLQVASGLLATDKDINGKNLDTYWITPAGFPVRQKYQKTVLKQLKTFTTGNILVKEPFKEDTILPEGTLISPAVIEPTDKIDSRKQRQGIAPNYVHSMDASHLMLTVGACVDKGVESFAMIHDSYGAPAGHGDIMFNTVREVFVDTYTKNDVLQDLHDHVENLLSPKALKDLPELPSKGKLDLNLVKESMYAFS